MTENSGVSLFETTWREISYQLIIRDEKLRSLIFWCDILYKKYSISLFLGEFCVKTLPQRYKVEWRQRISHTNLHQPLNLVGKIKNIDFYIFTVSFRRVARLPHFFGTSSRSGWTFEHCKNFPLAVARLELWISYNGTSYDLAFVKLNLE